MRRLRSGAITSISRVAALVAAVAGCLFMAASPLAASDRVLGGQLYSNGGEVEVTILGGDANDTSTLYLFSPAPQRLVGTNREAGKVVNLGTYPVGVELIFGIRNEVTGKTYYTGPGHRNPDGIAHAYVEYLDQATAVVGFEDIFGGGDQDYNDNIWNFTAVVKLVPPVVTPPSDQWAYEGELKPFDLGSFTDPDSVGPWDVNVDWADGSPNTYFNATTPGPLGTRPHLYGDNAVYNVTVKVTDNSSGDFGAAPFKITVLNLPPVVAVPSTVPAPSHEGSAIIASATFTDPGLNDAPFTCTVNYGDGSGELPGIVTGMTCNGPEHIYVDNGSYPVVVSVTDKDGAPGSNSTTQVVRNVAPTVGAIVAPIEPTLVETAISTSASFTDPGRLDTHTAEWDWGDGSQSSGSVDEANGSGSVSGNHTYSAAGVYTIKLTVTDKDGDSGQSVFQYVVVYDPSAGFVTGGGWINSPMGAFTADPNKTGKANFGFVSKYQRGASVPTGQTQFQFHAGDLNFHSTAYQWLVISGSKAQYKGSGMVNGSEGYGFLLTANDGQVTGGGGTDRFRLKIWNTTTGDIVYDNQQGDAEDALASQAIEGGSITLHDGK